MKKGIAVLFIGFLASTAIAQGFADKLKNKISGSSGADENKEWVSLGEISKKWTDGAYSTRRQNQGMWESTGKKEVKFIKDATGEIEFIEAFGKKYEASSSTGVSYVMSYASGMMKLYITETAIFNYRVHSSGIIVEDMMGEKVGVGKIKNEIAAFRKQAQEAADSQQGDYEAAQKAEREKKAAERKAKYGLEGKEVSKIEIINFVVPDMFGHYSAGPSFDMKATLKDGSVISTEGSEEGFISDYVITYDEPNYTYGKLEKGFVADDKLTITVKLASDDSKVATKYVTIKYNQDITNKWNGTSWSRSAGENAMNYKIEVKAIKHAVDGSDLRQIRITNVSQGGTLVDEYKINADQTLHFFCNGGNGGSDDGRGSNGGDGGNLTVIKDPNVKFFNLDYSNNGGRGGKGSSASYDGRDGRDGVYREEVRAVKF